MNREEIERICSTNDVEMVRIDSRGNSAISQYSANKCGNITRDGVSYPDMIEFLIYNKIKNRGNSSGAIPFLGDDFFSGLHDVYFVVSRTTSTRNRASGNYESRSHSLGMYYAKTRQIIEEDIYFFNIITEYDLYIDSNISTSGNIPTESFVRETTPRCVEEDATGLTICQRSRDKETASTNNTRHRRGGSRTYYRRDQEELKKHFTDNILPGIKSYVCNVSREEINHVPKAMTVCVAISKDAKFLPDTGEPTSTSEYDWFKRTKLQNDLRGLKFRKKPNSAFSLSSQTLSKNVNVRIAVDSSHHKKHDNLYLSFENKKADLTDKDRCQGTLFAQAISTSQSPGNMMNELRLFTRQTQTGTDLGATFDSLSRKVLMSERAGLKYYEDYPSDAFVNLTPLTNSDTELTLVRVSDASKSPKGENFSDLCQFGEGVFEAIIDRPLELVNDARKMTIEPGTYVIAIDNIETADIIWYAGLTSHSLSDITLKEIRSRLAVREDSRRLNVDTIRRSRSPRMSTRHDEVMPTRRIGRGDVLANKAKDDEDDDDWTGLGNLFG